jgi:hypothetical protein
VSQGSGKRKNFRKSKARQAEVVKMNCVVCSEKCIAMCPRCKAAVHHSYGQQGHPCSSIHDQACKEPAALKKVKEVGKSKVAKK